MNIYFSDFFGIPAELLDEYGALNISLINDLPLFIDPFLLFNSHNPVYKKLHNEIIQYMIFLKDMSSRKNIDKHLVKAWFTFPEVKQNWLGFCKKGNGGSGLGIDFANNLNRNLNTVFHNFGQEIISKSSHLEKLCLIKDGVGKDNISDFTTNLIKSFLAEYTQTFARKYLSEEQIKQVSVDKVCFNYKTRSWERKYYRLPYINGDYILLTPTDILTKEDVWINRPELIDSFRLIASNLPNEVLRSQINEYLVRALANESELKKDEVKEIISEAIERFPEILDYYILEKEKNGEEATNTSNERVAEVKKQFIDNICELVSNYLLPTHFYDLGKDTHQESFERVLFLKDVIENKGGHRVLYLDGKPIKRESDLQLLFRLTWFATPSDISREVNDGRGAVDFKASRGFNDKTLVEFKLAKNTHLEKNLSNQCPIYEKASDSTHPSIKVIMYFSRQEHLRVSKILKKLKLDKDQNIVLIDARNDNKPSASIAA